MTDDGPHDSIREFAGDDAGAVVLRDGLSQLSAHYAGTPLGDQMAAVLAGRLDLRDLAGDPEFAAMTTEFTRQFSEEWEQLGPAERSDLLRQGDALVADLEPEVR